MINQKIIKTIIMYKILVFIAITHSIAFSSSDYLWPTDASKTLTGVFGDIRPFRYHTGIDIRTYGYSGHDVYAIEDGYVSRILVSTSGYGKTIYITMVDGNTSVYAHLDRFNDKIEMIKSKLQSECDCYTIDNTFSKGQIPVLKGDIIGYTGDTGSLSGPHLHFEIRNKKGEPFNPLLTNYRVKDTLHPIPKKLIFKNLDKNSFINGVPNELELDLEKISDQKYICNDIVSIVGEFGISLEVYDRINSQRFDFGIYNISLEIDQQKVYESKYNHIGFEEGPKVFNERDYEKYTYDRKKVYNLYKKNSLSPSSFIKDEYYNRLIFEDNSLHKAKITVSDFNGNKVEIEFALMSDKFKESKFDVTQKSDGIIIEAKDSTIKNLSVQLADRYYNGIYHDNIPVDLISKNEYYIKFPDYKFDIISYQPIYDNQTVGATQFYSVMNRDIDLDGEINFIDKDKGVVFEFIEKEFSNKNPVLGLLLDEVLYRYPLYRIEKNKFTSDLFYPLELRGLTKASVFYIDSSIHQLSLEIKSEISVLGVPTNLEDGRIKIKSDGSSINNIEFDKNDNNETFLYLKACDNPSPDKKNEIHYGPFILGPQTIPLRSKFDIIYSTNNPQIGLYKFDFFNEKWKFLDNKLYSDGIGATVKSGGVFAAIKDIHAPIITRTIPKIGSTYRENDLDYIQFYLEDEQSGIADENNISVFLNDRKLIVEYNSYRGVVLYKLENRLKPGKHEIKIEVEDNSTNKSLVMGNFYIK